MIASAHTTIERVADRSAIVAVRSATPLHVLTPKNHGDAAWAYLSSHGGGFVGADDVHLDVHVTRDATFFLSSQSSTKVYRNTSSRFRLDARIDEGATLVSWPDPIVCFADASLDQRTHLVLHAHASALVVDAWTAARMDLLVINKTDLASFVGASLDVMERDAKKMRGDGPTVFAQVTKNVGVDAIAKHVVDAWKNATTTTTTQPK